MKAADKKIRGVMGNLEIFGTFIWNGPVVKVKLHWQKEICIIL